MTNITRVTWDKIPSEIVILIDKFLLDIAPEFKDMDMTVSLNIAHDQCLGITVCDNDFPEDSAVPVDWNFLSQRGILYAINRYLLHKRGYALARDPDTGYSPFILEVEDDVWGYTEADIKEGEATLEMYNVTIPEQYL